MVRGFAAGREIDGIEYAIADAMTVNGSAIGRVGRTARDAAARQLRPDRDHRMIIKT